ncbi:DUF4382 domain-containing protein [Halanaerobaculum tunisiense]
MKMKKIMPLILVLSLSLLVVGCSGLTGDDSLSGDSGELILSMSDAPVNNADHVYVTLDKVEVHNAETGWETINNFEDKENGELEIDLLNFRFDKELLGRKMLPNGTYDQIRLYVAAKDQDTTNPNTLGKSYVVYEDSDGNTQKENIFIPSGVQSGLKINKDSGFDGFTIKEGITSRLVLDNDVSKLLNQAGKSPIKLKPTAIDVINKVISGDIEGRVLADTDGATEAITENDVVVEAIQNKDVVKSTVATTEETTEDKTRPAGSFKLRGLEKGTYTINAYVKAEDGTEYKLPTKKQPGGTEEITIDVTAEETNEQLIDNPLQLQKQ